jgi:hypothetical protein
MKKGYCRAIIALLLFILCNVSIFSQDSELQYPYYLIDSHNPTSECWTGINKTGGFPATVDPNTYLVGPPPSIMDSAVTLPADSWVELLFRGVIVDGPGYDINISEMDPVGEEALIFLTDGNQQEYLFAKAKVPNTNTHEPTILGFDIAGLTLPFEPRAIRVVGIDFKGGSPGFDLSFASARLYQDNDEAAHLPYPPNKAENVPFNSILNWIPGSFAGKYNVYLGADISDVYPDAHTIQEHVQPQDVNYFDPNTLELGKTYFWRIDEVNESDPNKLSTGNVWSFTVADSFVLDDFDDYDSSYTINDKWKMEGYGYRTLVTDPQPVHSCRYSMEVDFYFGDSRYSIATSYFDKPQNWISAGIKTIELYFHGYANNMTGSLMYIILGDGNVEVKIPYDKDMNNTSLEKWQLWRIDLTSLGLFNEYSSDANSPEEHLDMSKIKYLSVGFEQAPDIPNAYGYGVIYFDDIRFYSSRCLPENSPEGDTNCDCTVDFRDFSELANNWLESGYSTYQVIEPNNAPVLWYEFDNSLDDTMGKANGVAVGDQPQFVPGVFGNAIKFDGFSNSINVAPVEHIISEISKGITIAFWQKGDDSPYKRDTLFCSEYEYNNIEPAISINLGCWNGTGIYNWDCGTHLPFDRRLTGKHRYKQEWVNQWNHWAFTKDLETGVMQVFLNGALINSRSGSSTSISVFDSFTIGTGWYGSYDGLMDDLRIYDYALMQPEIAFIATNGTGIFDIPLMTPADLHNDNKIDYSDLSILAENWLEKQLFPGE